MRMTRRSNLNERSRFMATPYFALPVTPPAVELLTVWVVVPLPPAPPPHPARPRARMMSAVIAVHLRACVMVILLLL